ncbi:superoxide dismutase, Ni [Halobacteriovorax marinus]|uniref:Superoxide dismutase, Ni n=1 Tax=Halobacteriovorax marinus TaxID=97084 RepID=A0A1Y5F4V8_9BACT|nr:superoxide dismutase, Ni [Halobacteriovorax marinus]
MIHAILETMDSFAPFKTVKAHCDVPCGVYDPTTAVIAAMTVARMTDTILELEEHEIKDHQGTRDLHYQNKITRMINEKERSAEIVKEEVRIIWGDFFKEPQFKQFPQIHSLVHEVLLLASKCKQNIDQDATRDLVTKLNDFSEIFWKIKNIKFKNVTYHCKPNLEVILPEL